MYLANNSMSSSTNILKTLSNVYKYYTGHNVITVIYSQIESVRVYHQWSYTLIWKLCSFKSQIYHVKTNKNKTDEKGNNLGVNHVSRLTWITENGTSFCDLGDI